MSSTSPLGRVLSTRHLRPSDLDWHVLVIAFVLLASGMMFVHGLSTGAAGEFGGDISYVAHRQKVFITAPAVVLGLLLRREWVRRNAGWIYGASILLLVAVYLVGEERNNAQRWIQLPRFDLQPSELAKVAMIVALARVLSLNRMARAHQWVLPLAVAGLPLVLVAGQPDLGTAMTLVPVTVGMFYLAGARGPILAGLCALGLAAGFVAREADLVRDYQLERVETWIETYSPDELITSRDGAAFHLYHARVVAGNGGLLGRGLGNGVASKTGLLPERDSDSIFMVVAEEGGFVGAAGIVVLYIMMSTLLLLSASGLRDRFARLVVGGVGIYFAAHLLINVSVNVGLLPMTGLTLPLFSTGGSSLLATFLALGLAVGMAAHKESLLDEDAFKSY
ncbi:MAG TPA: hypothetical protein EYQ74_11745 [Planctomycetes bacterium]|nr:hypothetical protein [Planctomycetota bacterium]HIK61889.1 hypothetical protein [Planctomycetota bacterium]